MSSNRIAVVIGVALGAVAPAGCGSDSGGGAQAPATTAARPVILDTKRVEHAIEDRIRTERKVKADVDCPSGVQQSKGRTFHCVATTAAGTTDFVVRQADGRGNVTYAAR